MKLQPTILVRVGHKPVEREERQVKMLKSCFLLASKFQNPTVWCRRRISLHPEEILSFLEVWSLLVLHTGKRGPVPRSWFNKGHND